MQGSTFCKVLDIKREAEVVREDVIAEPCPVVEVKVQDAAAPAGTWGGPQRSDRVDTFPFRFEKTSPSRQREPGQPRLMAFWQPTQKFFGTLLLKGDEKDEVTVRLGPSGTITGRLMARANSRW